MKPFFSVLVIPASRVFVLLIAVLFMFGGNSSRIIAASDPDTTGWKDLIALDFSNVVDPGHWTMEDGVLVAKDHDTLWTKDSYGNFILDLEFKVAKESNSGIFLRSSDIKKTLSALEIQVHESTDNSKYGMVGALYDAKPTTKNMTKPVGDWNHLTITCRDSLVSVVLNGEEVMVADLNEWPEVKKNPDGTPNKFPVALKDFAGRGRLVSRACMERRGAGVVSQY